MTTETGNQVATVEQQPRAVRTFTRVDDATNIMDTARFEHMQRIADVMARSSLIPDGLRLAKAGDENTALPPATVLSNCFLVTNQALRWGMDPFAVAQCASVVHGRLMWEGKLVAAVVEERGGVSLSYQFGTWIPATESVDLSKVGTGDLMAVVVTGTFPDGRIETIEGSVGIWKTDGKGSPWKAGSMKRQLRYRGAREFGRAYTPGVMLGVYAEDEIENIIEARVSVRSVSTLTTGFGDEGTQPRIAAPAKPDPVKEPVKEQPKGEETNGKAEGEATKASEQVVEAEKKPADSKVDENGADDGLTDTVAPAGTPYRIRCEGPNEAGRYVTYKDGQPFSTVTEKGAAKVAVFDAHAPTPEQVEEATVEQTENDPTQDIVSPEDQIEDAEVEEIAETSEDDEGEGQEMVEDHNKAVSSSGDGGPIDDFRGVLDRLDSWDSIKTAFKAFAGSDFYQSAEGEGRRMAREQVWEAYESLFEQGKTTTAISDDLTLFRIWLESKAASSDQIDSLFRKLFKSEAYQKATEKDRQDIGRAAQARKDEMKGAG